MSRTGFIGRTWRTRRDCQVNTRHGEDRCFLLRCYRIPLVRERQKREAKRELEAKLRESLMDGPAEPMTREDWAALRQRVIDRRPELRGPG
jgi:hypothetical protein